MAARLFTPKRAVASADESALPLAANACPETTSGPLRKGREAAALLLFAIAVFLTLALASLRTDPQDPAFSGADWVGPVGASLSGVLVRAFGLVAWFAPIELALLSAPLFTKRTNQANALRLAGDLVVAIVLSALVQVVAPNVLAFGRAPHLTRQAQAAFLEGLYAARTAPSVLRRSPDGRLRPETVQNAGYFTAT